MFDDLIRWLLGHTVLLVGFVFLLMATTTYWPGRKARFARDAMIPLRDDHHASRQEPV